MTTLPNIELTQEELFEYQFTKTSLFGAEGKIFPGNNEKEVRKIFFYPLSGEPRSLKGFYLEMENKLNKLKALHQKKIQNDIIPLATISYQDTIVGYDMTSPNLKKADSFDMEKLQQLREKLKHFHNQGIIHGDIKESNILLNPQGEIVLCDLDNMQVDEYPIDYLNYTIEFFPTDTNLVDENADIYLYNLFFLKQQFYQKKDYEEIIDEIIYENFPEELKGESIEELYKMQRSFIGYQGKYLIDTYTKRKSR